MPRQKPLPAKAIADLVAAVERLTDDVFEATRALTNSNHEPLPEANAQQHTLVAAARDLLGLALKLQSAVAIDAQRESIEAMRAEIEAARK